MTLAWNIIMFRIDRLLFQCWCYSSTNTQNVFFFFRLLPLMVSTADHFPPSSTRSCILFCYIYLLDVFHIHNSLWSSFPSTFTISTSSSSLLPVTCIPFWFYWLSFLFFPVHISTSPCSFLPTYSKDHSLSSYMSYTILTHISATSDFFILLLIHCHLSLLNLASTTLKK